MLMPFAFSKGILKLEGGEKQVISLKIHRNDTGKITALTKNGAFSLGMRQIAALILPKYTAKDRKLVEL